jgi:hypothetical protein
MLPRASCSRKRLKSLLNMSDGILSNVSYVVVGLNKRCLFFYPSLIF